MAARREWFGRYVWLWILGVSVGWFEAAVVVYLRELYYPGGFDFPVVLASGRVALVELGRELASLFLLAAAARLAGRAFIERFAAFALLFGVWDLVYYGVLKLVLGWPSTLATWDILFLLPWPWVGPVWAPCVVSLALVAGGSYVYWTADHPRAPRPLDWGVLSLGGLTVVGAFLAEGHVVLTQTRPQAFPSGVFWSGLLVALSWFVAYEWRARHGAPRA
jgi:hypothetical protein